MKIVRVCDGEASQAGASPTITPKGVVSKDSAAMEQTFDMRTHTHLGRAAAESSIRQSKSILLICRACAIISL